MKNDKQRMNMSITNLHINENYSRYISIVLLFCVSFLISVWLQEKTLFDENMVTYSPAEIHMFDKSLFPHDIDVTINENEFSPRYTSLVLISFLMQLGLSYENVYLLLYLFSNAIIATACVCFLYFANIKNKLLGAISFSTIFGISRLGILGGFSVFPANALMVGLGCSFGILATVISLYHRETKYINLAYGLVCLAALSHIHEGIWSFAFVSLVHLYYTHKLIPYRAIAFYVSVLVLLALTIPALLSGQYAIPTADFFAIYVKERIPHHLLLSYNGWTSILSFALTWCVLIYLNRTNLIEKRQHKFYISLIGLFALTLCAWYGFTEVLHISAFVKLYVAKFVKYISIPFCLLLVSYMDNLALDKKNWFLLAAIVLCSFVEHEIWLYTLLLAIFVVWLPIDKKYQIIAKLAYIIICFSLFIFESSLASLSIRILIVLGCVVAMFKPSFLRDALYLVIIIGGLSGHVYHLVHPFSLQSYIDYRIKKHTGEDVFQIAHYISGVVPKDQIILGDALTAESSFIQHISRRSMYVLDKTVPSSDLGIKIWHDRIVETKDFCQWTPEQAAEFMREKELQYVTVNTQSMAHSYGESSLFTKETEQGNFILYKLQQ